MEKSFPVCIQTGKFPFRATAYLPCQQYFKKMSQEKNILLVGNQPIISESLLYDVQDYLNGKKKTYRAKVGSLTARLNEAVELIYSLDKGFSQNENGQPESFFDLSILVPGTGV